MSEKQAPYLHLVRGTPSDGAHGDAAGDQGQTRNGASSPSDGQPAPGDVAGEPSSTGAGSAAQSLQDVPLNAPLQQAIMYAAVSWVALCIERATYAVDIQPIAARLYEVSMHYADAEGQDAGEGIILRVRLEVEPGLVLRTAVEPVRP